MKNEALISELIVILRAFIALIITVALGYALPMVWLGCSCNGVPL